MLRTYIMDAYSDRSDVMLCTYIMDAYSYRSDKQDQKELLREMVDAGVNAILIKTASMGRTLLVYSLFRFASLGQPLIEVDLCPIR